MTARAGKGLSAAPKQPYHPCHSRALPLVSPGRDVYSRRSISGTSACCRRPWHHTRNSCLTPVWDARPGDAAPSRRLAMSAFVSCDLDAVGLPPAKAVAYACVHHPASSQYALRHTPAESYVFNFDLVEGMAELCLFDIDAFAAIALTSLMLFHDAVGMAL